jgi:hypothetical protein
MGINAKSGPRARTLGRVIFLKVKRILNEGHELV